MIRLNISIIYSLMLEKAIILPDFTFSHQLSQEIEQIINNDPLHQHLSHILEQINTLCYNQVMSSLQDQLIGLVEEFANKISLKMKHIAQSCSLEMSQHRLKFRQYENKYQEMKEQIHTLNQTIQSLNQKISNWQNEYEALKVESAEMQEKYERRLKQVKREKKQIKQTFRMVQQSTEIERALLQNLQIQKQEISEQILSQKREKETLINELEQFKQKIIETEYRLSASASKLSWQEKRIQKLEEQSLQKQKLIHKLMQQIKSLNQKDNNQFDRHSQISGKFAKSFHEEISHQDAESNKKHVSFIESFKLSDQILNLHENYEITSTKSYRKSNYDQREGVEVLVQNLEIQRNIEEDMGQAEAQHGIDEKAERWPLSPPPSRVNMPDFYLAHFLLTSQAIKIKMNNQKFLRVDLSTQYSRLISERVPFHMWDEWITQKLKELARRE